MCGEGPAELHAGEETRGRGGGQVSPIMTVDEYVIEWITIIVEPSDAND